MPPKKKTLKLDEAVPQTWEQWDLEAQKLRIATHSILQRARLLSGSKIDRNQYLLLKVLWDVELPCAWAVNELNLGQFYHQAANWLAAFVPFQTYVDHLEDLTLPSPEMGIFEIPYYQQREVRRFFSDAPKRVGLKRINEEVVNASLVSFLMAICMKHPKVQATWTPRRASLLAEFRKATMECKLDGFLYSNLTSQTQVILEAKAKRRDNHAPDVFWQEAAVLVAALRTPPPKGLKKSRAFLISQDGDLLYFAATVPNDQYHEFLLDKKEPSNEENFLRIKQWGPWMISRRKDVEDFARLILAVVLQASAEEVSAQS
ncbi:hypothetical protein P168DRAFT_285086 [Aspergillus campestris IBT 28561]|uniref:Uncharacterized protein n=1 Tax=Aspergillus campestris (strain IBT 28561) TaxID=1392248 RepID=A0A2I1CTI7_ASPC2|nr:uncharacterized protein P168DRAFT_285086 [Aspergillus campestris IBT 28561]PKY00946.1 hypothetical protein P168DRAFT_285086 [Aspergillus campestris IBT 28561]